MDVQPPVHLGGHAPEGNSLPFPLFDFHAHLPGELPRYRWGWEAWFEAEHGEDKLRLLNARSEQALRSFLERRGFPIPNRIQPPPREAAARYAEAVGRYGLAGICFVTGGGNDVLAEAIRGHPKLYGFAHHDPFEQDAPLELTRALEHLGLRGYKILATALRRPLTSPELRPLWEVCEAHGVPVVVHFGPLGAGGGIVNGPNVNPLSLHDIAKGFPKVSFVVPHFGVGYVRELMQLMWACENVWVDTSGSNQWRHYTWPEPSLVDLFRAFYTRFGPTRIVFGTDSSHFPRGWVVAYALEQLEAARQAGIPASAMEAIFRDNAMHLLKLK
ncbi:MAG: amidohydrolase family protein [Candidatus Bipolaricaulaceae bacterium]